LIKDRPIYETKKYFITTHINGEGIELVVDKKFDLDLKLDVFGNPISKLLTINYFLFGEKKNTICTYSGNFSDISIEENILN